MEIISASSKRIQDAISRVPRRNLFLRGDWRGYGFQHWRGSCQASSRDLSGQWSSLLCFPYLASAPADQSALHTLMTVLLRPIPRLHRAATGTTALSMQRSSSAGTCTRSMKQGTSQLLERDLELLLQCDCSQPMRGLRHSRVHRLALRFH